MCKLCFHCLVLGACQRGKKFASLMEQLLAAVYTCKKIKLWKPLCKFHTAELAVQAGAGV